MKLTEDRFNAIVAACQWSSSWFVAAAFLVVLLGAKPPEVVKDGFIWAIAAGAPLFLTVGMYQTWRLPDKRKLLAIPASLFLILSAVLIFGAIVQQNRVDEYHKAVDEARASVAWQTAKSSYDAVLADYQTLAARTFPADFPLRFAQNEAAKAEKWKQVEAKAAAVVSLEPKPVQGSGSVFDIFGADKAWIVFSVFLALYSVVNEIIAMALSYRRKKPAEKAREEKQGSPAPSQFGVEEYLTVAKKIGRNGKLAGALAVSMETGQTEWTCKLILQELLKTGRLKVSGPGKAPEEVGA